MPDHISTELLDDASVNPGAWLLAAVNAADANRIDALILGDTARAEQAAATLAALGEFMEGANDEDQN